ncbi:MAG: hypothetical protein ACREPS_08335, partial [Rhodanobacteraceae bacterium]
MATIPGRAMMKKMWLRALIALLGMGPLAVWASPREPALLHGFDAYVQHAMKVWRVPGLAIAIVDDDHIVMEKGFG